MDDVLGTQQAQYGTLIREGKHGRFKQVGERGLGTLKIV
jgi:hypothetical protein